MLESYVHSVARSIKPDWSQNKYVYRNCADVAGLSQLAPLGADGSFSGVRVMVQTVHLDLSDVALGDSIAINGACVTVVALDTVAKTFAVDVSHESLSKTSGLDRIGHVNLEKAMRLSRSSGRAFGFRTHVDDVARIVSRSRRWASRSGLIFAAPINGDVFSRIKALSRSTVQA